MTRAIVVRAIALLAVAGALAFGVPESSQAGRGGVFNHGNGLKVRVGRPHGGAFKPLSPSVRHGRRHKHKGFRRSGFGRGFGVFPWVGSRSQPAPPRQPRKTVATPLAPPPSPGVKWIHVGPTGDDTLLSGTALAQGEAPSDCLSVETEILLDDRPVNAFGIACRQADGTWRLRPAEPAPN